MSGNRASWRAGRWCRPGLNTAGEPPQRMIRRRAADPPARDDIDVPLSSEVHESQAQTRRWSGGTGLAAGHRVTM